MNNCLLQEKIFHEFPIMDPEKKNFRKEMYNFGKKSKKKVTQMVYQAASKSEYNKYSKIFMEENSIFEADNHAVWQKKTQAFGI